MAEWGDFSAAAELFSWAGCVPTQTALRAMSPNTAGAEAKPGVAPRAAPARPLASKGSDLKEGEFRERVRVSSHTENL